MGFLAAASRQKYDTAVQYLDTRASGRNAATLAKQLFVVLDRKLPAKLNTVSDDPRGSMSDPTDSRRELIGSVAVGERSGVDIYLERVEQRKAGAIWLFSRQTLVDIPDVYKEITATTVEYLLPTFLLKKYFGVSLFAWTYLLVFLPSFYLALSLLNRLLVFGVGYALRRWAPGSIPAKLCVLPHPLRLFAVSCTVFITVREISLSLFMRQIGSTVAALLLIVSLVWAAFMVNARCESYLKKRMEDRRKLGATAVLRPARRVMDFIAVVAGLMFVLHTLGIDPTATLAGLGVGGIAIALAAQKTLENLIGGTSLIMDGAVRVGDTFKIGNVIGTVEVIGLRSTRVRTPDRTLVTIPNGQMATMTLENLSARDQFCLRHLICLEVDTAPAKLNTLLTEVRLLLERDSRVLPLTSRVSFQRFAEYSLELEVFAYLVAQDSNDFLRIQEEVLIQIRDLLDSAGVKIASPSRTIHLAEGKASNVKSAWRIAGSGSGI